MSGNGKDLSSERQALQAVETHHADMLRHLNGLVGLLTETVEAGDAGAAQAAQATLLDWCDKELVPHALAEEGPLYSGPHGMPEAKLLVDGMLAEHQVIVGLIEELRTADGVAAAVAAGAIQRIFALHLDKENRLLMPFVIQSPALSLAHAVEGLHELVGEGAAHHHKH
ncbi:hemerythrin domain-containing protein [Arthrobacter sp. FW306-05-C]|uniref:hemerythrin domain-containing protein n=1 Tax=unclassified Arthrobacter TaxID=235627 RepID=UPI001EF03E31|nr:MULTISPECIES: hemerythrin domain-containing protein [unclassified Arthrobacter]UKA65106.1 hemerythrin domain-containing protein [Arthrobacter sp. FW306-05-C]UKA73778.1 hemerythrin domain-containing protein [Arthrobacter sp. FW306-07-I]